MPRKYITEETKSEIREFYLSKPMTYDVLIEKYHLSYPTIIKILRDIPKWEKYKIYNPNIKEDYFETIDSEMKAYFIGLMIADGNVFEPYDGRSCSTSITLDNEDKYILERFRKELGVNNIVANDGRGCSYMAIKSNKIAQDLKKYGIVPRKTLTTYLPQNIDEKLMRHLVRGILDGDGSLYIKQREHGFMHRISFCGTLRLMTELSEYLTKTLALSLKPKVYTYKNRQLSEFKLQSYESVSKFLHWVYDDATIFLKRKKEKADLYFQHICQHVDTEVIL
jgi:hypothetical protein